MRLVIFSDVHGNPFALQAVLKAISTEGELDAVVAAGDHCLGGSAPAACVEMIQEAGVMAVYGNTEEYLLAPQRVPPDELHRSQWDTILPTVHWTNEQLEDSHRTWLAGLPFSLRFSPNANTAADLVVVHANPRNCELMLLPAEADQRALWDEVRQPDDDPSLSEAMLDFTAGTLVFGHFHTPALRVWKGITLVDVSPVSLPSIDHDRRARYSLVTWNGTGWDVVRRAVNYNVQSEQSALQGCGMPNWTRFSNTFD